MGERLTRLSGRLVFSVRFVQDVGAASHPEVVVDPPEPPVRENALVVWLTKPEAVTLNRLCKLL